MKRVVLVTAAEARDLDDDLPPLLRALREIGVDAEAVVGDAFAADVVRSTWDYVPKHEAFLAWAERAARLANSPDILRWNTDKRYLRELARGGAPVLLELELAEPSLFLCSPTAPSGASPARSPGFSPEGGGKFPLVVFQEAFGAIVAPSRG